MLSSTLGAPFSPKAVEEAEPEPVNMNGAREAAEWLMACSTPRAKVVNAEVVSSGTYSTPTITITIPTADQLKLADSGIEAEATPPAPTTAHPPVNLATGTLENDLFAHRSKVEVEPVAVPTSSAFSPVISKTLPFFSHPWASRPAVSSGSLTRELSSGVSASADVPFAAVFSGHDKVTIIKALTNSDDWAFGTVVVNDASVRAVSPQRARVDSVVPALLPAASLRRLGPLPRRLSTTSSPAQPVVSAADSRSSSGELSRITRSAPATASNVSVVTCTAAQLAATTAFTKRQARHCMTVPRSGIRVEVVGTLSTPRQAAQAQSVSETPTAGLTKSMSAMRLMDDSPSPRKGNFLRLTPEVGAQS